MRRWMSPKTLVPGMLLVACGLGCLNATPAGAASSKSPVQVAQKSLVVNMLSLINADRMRAGLPAVQKNKLVTQVALAHSLDMASHNYLSHNSQDGATPFKRLLQGGVRYTRAGEVIGFEATTDATAAMQAIEQMMMADGPHRAIVLGKDFTHVGIGIVTAGQNIYVTEDFVK